MCPVLRTDGGELSSTKKMSDVAIETPNALITSPSTISIFAFFFYSVIFIFHVIFHVIVVAISPI